MATTVGQHSVATFTSPVNGTTPIDANTVRGNDNTMRTAYVDHDADPGIHLQSSSLSSRPVAGTDGRKWLTFDSGRYQLWYDDGTRWHEVASDAVNVDCLSDTALTKGDVVKVTGFNNGQNLPTVAKVASASDIAFGVVENTVGSNTIVQIINTGLIENVDTNGYAVGTVLYPNTTGGWTSTKPTSGTYQPAAYVLRGNSSTGVLYVECSAPRIVERSDNTASTLVLRDASGNFSAGTITANLTGNISGTAPAGTLTGTTLASNVVTSSLTTVGTIGTGVWQGTAIANAYIASGLDVAKLTVGTTLPSNVVTSSLTTVGTIGSGTWQGTAIANAYIASGLDVAKLTTGTTLPSNVTASSLTSVGTLSSLTVSGNITTTAGNINIASGQVLYLSGAGGNAYLQESGGTVFIGAGGAGRVRLDASGNLGLGVTPSAWGGSYKALQLPGGAIDSFGSNAITMICNAYDASAGAWTYKNTGVALRYDQNSSGSHVWLNAPSGTAGNAITFTQAMTLNASGDLLVGTTTANLSTSGRGLIVANGSASSILSLENGGTTAFYLFANGDNVDVFNSRNGFIRFATNSTERARIDSSGNLLVGTTSAQYNASGRGVIEVNGSSEALIGLKTGGTGRMYLQSFAADNYIVSANAPLTLSAQGANSIIFGTNGTDRVRIKSTGQVRFVPLSADPAGAENGDVYYNSTTNKLRVYAGGAWVDLH